MKNLILKLRNSEFLSLAEVLRLKVSLVLIFLFIFGALTIPFSIFEDLSINIKIIVPSVFLLLFIMTSLMLAFNKVRLSMHFSIYIFIALTVYYLGSSSELYGYLLIFITLTIIIFYQDIYAYIIYGGVLTAYGVIYLLENSDMMAGVNVYQMSTSMIIYQYSLIGFFMVFLIYFILVDTSYEKLNNDYLETDKYLERYRDLIIRYVEEFNEKEEEPPFIEKSSFHQAVSEITIFISEILEINQNKISEVIEFYFFLHSQNIEEVLNNDQLPTETLKYAKQFKKYLLNKNNEMESLIQDIAGINKQTFENTENHYLYNINDIFTNRSNRLLALVSIYKFLRTEVTQFDKWGRVDRVLEHDEIKEIIQSKMFRKFISFEDVNFFLTNEELFKIHLK